MISGRGLARALGLLFLVSPACAAPCQWRWAGGEGGTTFNQFQFLDAQDGFAQNGECLWKTGDGGGHWGKVYCAEKGPASWPDRNAIRQLQFADAGRGWLLTKGGALLRTLDGGKSWTRQEFPGHIVRSFRFLDARRGWWVGEKSLEGVPDFQGAVFATADGGGTWAEQATGVQSKSRWRLADVWPLTEGEAWAVGDDVLLRTLDGGKSWKSRRAPGLGQLRNNAIRFFDGGVGLIVRSPADNFLLSRDGGRSWLARRPPLQAPGLDGLVFSGGQDAWAAMAGSLYHSEDGGRSWKKLPAGQTGAPGGDTQFYGLQYLGRERTLAAGAAGGGTAFCRLPP